MSNAASNTSTHASSNHPKSNPAALLEQQLEKTSKLMLRGIQDATSFNSHNVAAATRAAALWAEGVQNITEVLFASMQQSLQGAAQTGKALLGVKNLNDLVDLQSNYLKNSVDSALQDATRLSEITVRCSTQVAEPLQERVSQAVEKISDRLKQVA